MIVTFTIIALLIIVILFYIRQDKFGKAPDGERLTRIQQSPNFRDGKFQNLSVTPELAEGHNIAGVIYAQFFKKAPRRSPVDTIPFIKTDLKNLPKDQDVLIWFGHSSYLMQLDGKRILVDPVFSGNASPVPGTNKSFIGTDNYAVEDFPDIDYLFLSHDHYDHVDHETLIALRGKVSKVLCGLGVGAHLEYWGYDMSRVVEADWYDSLDLDSGFHVTVTPARHFSGRGFSRNNTLWVSFVLQTPSSKIFIGGDSGYDKHFAEIGKKFGPLDLAIIENGQYDDAWPYIHTRPHEVLQVAKDLNAKRLFPVHSSKFVMANHSWDEPLRRVTELNKDYNIPLVTPVIGQIVYLKDESQTFGSWWEGIE